MLMVTPPFLLREAEGATRTVDPAVDCLATGLEAARAIGVLLIRPVNWFCFMQGCTFGIDIASTKRVL